MSNKKAKNYEEDADENHEPLLNPSHARAWELAKRQGVKPIRSIKDLQGDFWPEEESIDDFLSWLRATRREDDKPRSLLE